MCSHYLTMHNNHFQVQPRAVVLEDNVELATNYQQVLMSVGYETTLAHNISDARLSIRDCSPELILIDIELPDGNGLDLMDELGASTRGRFIVISGNDTQRAAMKSIRHQAVELLIKPVSIEHLRQCLTPPVSSINMTSANDCSNNVDKASASDDDNISKNSQYPGFWIDYGSGSALKNLRIAASLSAERRRGHALICGPAGVDKLSVARAVHYRSRRLGECVVVDCASEQDDSARTRFFGSMDSGSGKTNHKGYLEQAKGGTLVLQNIQYLPSSIQSALMAFLDSGQFRPVDAVSSIRLVVAVVGITDELSDNDNSPTHGLRTDFVFRLAQVRLNVPGLSECVGDIESIACFILSTLVPTGEEAVQFSKNALEKIARTQWHGNIRELRSAIGDALTHHQHGQQLELCHYPSETASGQSDGVAINRFVGSSVWDFEKQLILGTLEHHAGDRKVAAKVLGISLKTLYNRLNSFS